MKEMEPYMNNLFDSIHKQVADAEVFQLLPLSLHTNIFLIA